MGVCWCSSPEKAPLLAPKRLWEHLPMRPQESGSASCEGKEKCPLGKSPDNAGCSEHAGEPAALAPRHVGDSAASACDRIVGTSNVAAARVGNELPLAEWRSVEAGRPSGAPHWNAKLGASTRSSEVPGVKIELPSLSAGLSRSNEAMCARDWLLGCRVVALGAAFWQLVGGLMAGGAGHPA
jgi:hypothetical protein